MGITSLVGGIITGKKQKKIAKQQKRIAQENARQANIQAEAERERQRIEQVRANVGVRKERQAQLREQRIRRASIIASAINSGAGLGSSATQAAIGGLSTQFGANQGNINQAQTFSSAISLQNEAAAQAQSNIIAGQGQQQVLSAKSNVVEAKGGLFNTIGGIESSLFSRGGGFTSLFGGNKPTGV